MPVQSAEPQTQIRTPALLPAPVLRRNAGVAELVVKGERLLVLGAEVHNSAASTPESARTAFAAVADVGANTVLAPVAWESVEPVEGVYDLTIVDDLIGAAREKGLLLVVLWFGAYKNGASTYAPTWVKADPARFPRCASADGSLTGTLSPFANTTRAADAAAFAAVVEHIETVDGAHRTVVMVQVQNEPGLLGSSRDHSPQATQLFSAAPPLEVLGAAGVESPQESWSAAFDDLLDADEHFMAWGFATYIEAVAQAGREHSAVPFFTNAWLDSTIDLPGFSLAGGQRPGTYPSGGPVARMLPVWRALAPSLDLVVPDIYFGDFDAICESFVSASGGLFIPEMRRDAVGVGDAFVAIGQHRSIGVAPFGVDSIDDDDQRADLRDAFELLAALGLRAGDATQGFHLLPDAAPESSSELDFGDVQLRATRLVRFGETTPPAQGAFGVVVRTGPTTFLAAGRGFSLTFHDPESRRVELLEVLEHPRERPTAQGRRPVSRRLNGDETAGGTAWLHPARLQEQSEVFPIPMSIRHTGISSCEIQRLG